MRRYKYDFQQLKDDEKNLESRGYARVNQDYKMLQDNKCVYLWGDPGCGKTFVMEQFYKHLDFKGTEK